MKNEITTQDRKELKKALVEKTGAKRMSSKQFVSNQVTTEIFLTKKGKYKALLQAVRGDETVVHELESTLNDLGYKVVEDLGFYDLGWKVVHQGLIIEKCLVNQVLMSVKSI